MKTLKYEEVYITEYANIAEARHQIAHFVETGSDSYRFKRTLERRKTQRMPIAEEQLTGKENSGF
jgi:hypothetical protein